MLSDFFTGGIARMRQTGHTLQSQLHAAGLALKVWQAQKELEAMEKWVACCKTVHLTDTFADLGKAHWHASSMSVAACQPQIAWQVLWCLAPH